MSDGEKLQKTMNDASKEFQKLPDWAKQQTSGTQQPVSVERTVRPTSETAKKR